MTMVENVLVDATNQPLPNVMVEIVLLAPTESSNAFTAAQQQVASRVVTRTDSNGQWSLDLFPNASISPDGTIYQVTHYVTGFYNQISYFIVPDDDDTHALENLLTGAP